MPPSIDLNHPAVSLKELVERQNAAVQQVLELQAAIARRMDTDGPVPIAHSLPRPREQHRELRDHRDHRDQRKATKESVGHHSTFRTQISPASQSDFSEPFLSPRGMSHAVTPHGKRHSMFFRGPETMHPTSGAASPTARRTTQAEKQALFPDAAELKRRVIDRLNRPIYNVEDQYKTQGVAQYCARSAWFRNITMMIILFNTIWISIDTDYNDALVLSHAKPIFIIMDNFFCVAFSFELFVRFSAFARKCNSFRDRWFVFDGVLVLFMVWETWIEPLVMSMQSGRGTSVLRIFRMLRLTRIARLARLLRNAPELMILIKGLGIAMRSVVATLSLMLLIIYIFAVAFTETLKEAEWTEGMFTTVPKSMRTLISFGVFPEGREFLDAMLAGGVITYLFSILFLIMTSLTVLNMLIGVICEVVSVTAEVEKEDLLLQEMKEKINTILGHTGDHHYGNTVSKHQLAALLDSQEAIDSFDSVGVDIFALVDFVDFIFPGNEDLEVTDFVKTVIRFRGSNNATVKDVVDMRMFLTNEIQSLVGFLVTNLQKKHSKPSSGV